MALPGEPWLLAWLAVFQFAVAWWWWKGPSLKGTRGWGAALFLLNGAATAFNAADQAVGSAYAVRVASLVDFWTQLFLVGLVLASVQDRPWHRWMAPLALATTGAALGYGTLTRLGFHLPLPLGSPSMDDLGLGLAMAIGGIGIAVQARKAAPGAAAAWLLVLAVIVMHMVEFAVSWALLLPMQHAQGTLVANAVYHAVRLLPLVPVALASAALARARLRAAAEVRADLDLAAALLAAGLFIGVARFGAGLDSSGEAMTAVLFSLAFVRPVVFVAAQARLEGALILRSSRGVAMAFGGCVLGVSYAAYLVAGLLWTTPGLARPAFGAMAAVLTLAAGRRAWQRLRESVLAPRAASQPGGWPLEPGRVPLPADWQRRVEANAAAFRALPPAAREGLARLARWQRIVLALDGAPPGRDGGRPYERTTPGLHLATHCPYSLIGPEVVRANERAAAIVAELGIRAPSDGALPPGPLIRSTWGTAEGLRSKRARIYELTPLGKRVAARLREEVGLGEYPSQAVAEVIGEHWEAGAD